MQNNNVLFQSKSNDQYVVENGVKYLILNGRKFRVLKDDENFTGKPAEEANERKKESLRLKELEIQDVMEEKGYSYEEAKDYVEWRSGIGEELFIQDVCNGEYDNDKNMLPSEYRNDY